jgi:predicted house-cleaning noncanonical NTP pyrophosphatase (MazG superfamily)
VPIYNKLVRDNIPQVIAASGLDCRTRILTDDEYRKELNNKLREETEEYFRAESPQEALEELVDLLELIRALARVHGADWEQLEALRAGKAEARGGFDMRVFLIDVDDR